MRSTWQRRADPGAARFLRAASLLAMLGAAAGLAAAGVRRHDVADSVHLQLAEEPAYASVGRVDSPAALGSGSLLAPQWVLTAAHVVEDATEVTFTLNTAAYTAAAWHLHPDWAGAAGSEGDLALIELTTPVWEADPAVLYTASDEVDREATIVGYGQSGTGDTGAVPGTSGTKRAGDNVIGGLGSVYNYSDVFVLSDLDDPRTGGTGKAAALDREYLGAPGDSGGGWFVDVGGHTYLAAVTSFAFAPTDGFLNYDYDDVMGATRVSQYAAWIEGYLPPPPTPGDINLDGAVDQADLDVLLGSFGTAAGMDWGDGDFTDDGAVDDRDLSVLLAHWTASASAEADVVPAPLPAALLAAGGWALLRRRPREVSMRAAQSPCALQASFPPATAGG